MLRKMSYVKCGAAYPVLLATPQRAPQRVSKGQCRFHETNTAPLKPLSDRADI